MSKHLDKSIKYERQSPTLEKGEVELRKKSSNSSEENIILKSNICVSSDEITRKEQRDLSAPFIRVTGTHRDQ